MKQYAFIDVSNTLGTVRQLLDFKIDWQKLLKHLESSNRWNCEKVFYYKGDRGTKKSKKELEKLRKIGYVIRTKLTLVHKNKSRDYSYQCEKCKHKGVCSILVPGNRKSNCDVELTVDALELVKKDAEFLIFSGDGDFAYLIEKLIEKGVRVKIVSNTGRNFKNEKTFSSRLKKIIEREELGRKRVSFVNINDWKRLIMK